ncbi:MAG: hypothetical protein WBA44_06850 [Mesorhizobium sp.]
MRTIIIAACLAATVLPASAISRLNTQTMQCENVQRRVQSEGAAILRYKSPRTNMTLYDRYVAHGGFCDTDEYAKIEVVPTADTPRCRVFKCMPRIDPFD